MATLLRYGVVLFHPSSSNLSWTMEVPARGRGTLTANCDGRVLSNTRVRLWFDESMALDRAAAIGGLRDPPKIGVCDVTWSSSTWMEVCGPPLIRRSTTEFVFLREMEVSIAQDLTRSFAQVWKSLTDPVVPHLVELGLAEELVRWSIDLEQTNNWKLEA